MDVGDGSNRLMPLSDNDSEIIRRYLLGKLTESDLVTTEQRLLTEDDFFEEFELTKDDLVEEYFAKQLNQDESRWLEQNLLASPEGKRLTEIAKSIDRYVARHPLAPLKKTSWFEGVGELWNSRPVLLRVAAGLAVVVIVAGIFWSSRAPSPQIFATLTLVSTSSTRSGGDETQKIRLDGKGLRLVLKFPVAVNPPVRYRVELMNGNGDKRTFEGVGNQADSVQLEIPAGELTRGLHAATLSTIKADGTLDRIPGAFHFTVE